MNPPAGESVVAIARNAESADTDPDAEDNGVEPETTE